MGVVANVKHRLPAPPTHSVNNVKPNPNPTLLRTSYRQVDAQPVNYGWDISKGRKSVWGCGPCVCRIVVDGIRIVGLWFAVCISILVFSANQNVIGHYVITIVQIRSS